MSHPRLFGFIGTIGLLLISFVSHAQSIPRQTFITSCTQECATSPNRHIANDKSNPNPIDQCVLIKYYADMVYDSGKNKRGAELIFQDICPKAFGQVGPIEPPK